MKDNCSLHKFTSGLLSSTGNKNSFHRTKGAASHCTVNNTEAQTTPCSIVVTILNQRANRTHLHAAQSQCKPRTHVWLCQTLPELNSSTENLRWSQSVCTEGEWILCGMTYSYMKRSTRTETVVKFVSTLCPICDILDSHNGVAEDSHLLRCDIVSLVSGSWHFKGFWCLHLAVSGSPKRISSWTAWPWRWRHHNRLQQCEPPTPTQQHSIISQSTWFLNL